MAARKGAAGHRSGGTLQRQGEFQAAGRNAGNAEKIHWLSDNLVRSSKHGLSSRYGSWIYGYLWLFYNYGEIPKDYCERNIQQIVHRYIMIYPEMGIDCGWTENIEGIQRTSNKIGNS